MIMGREEINQDKRRIVVCNRQPDKCIYYETNASGKKYCSVFDSDKIGYQCPFVIYSRV